MSSIKINTILQIWRAKLVQEGKIRLVRKCDG